MCKPMSTTDSARLPSSKQGIVASYIPDSAKRLPPQFHDPDGHWAATNLYVLTPGYNTDLVPKGTEPKTFQDLLDPKWKGKMAWNSQPSVAAATGFIGLVLADMGEEKGTAYLQALAKQNVTGLKVAARQVLDEVIAGEYSIALQIFNNHAVISAAQGRARGVDPDESGDGHSVGLFGDRGRSASQCGAALRRLSRLRGRPEALP